LNTLASSFRDLLENIRFWETIFMQEEMLYNGTYASLFFIYIVSIFY
jgi:hypothetical protein